MILPELEMTTVVLARMSWCVASRSRIGHNITILYRCAICVYVFVGCCLVTKTLNVNNTK